MFRRIAAVVLFAGLASSCAGASDTLRVTWLANEGVLLESSGSAVLIDAFVPEPYSIYTALPAETAAAMLAAEAPFGQVDIALASHRHRDHYQPEFAAKFLAAHPETRFWSSPQVLAGLESPGADSVFPGPGETISRRHANIEVDFLNLSHGSGRFSAIQNLGHVVRIGGFTVLHIGDAAMVPANFDPYGLVPAQIDVALVPYWYCSSKSGQKLISTHLAAGLQIAVHLPREGEDQAGMDSAAQCGDVVLPARPMQHWLLETDLED